MRLLVLVVAVLVGAPALARERQGGRGAESTFEAEADLRIGVTRDLELDVGCRAAGRHRFRVA
jgi:hypothetical protein